MNDQAINDIKQSLIDAISKKFYARKYKNYMYIYFEHLDFCMNILSMEGILYALIVTLKEQLPGVSIQIHIQLHLHNVRIICHPKTQILRRKCRCNYFRRVCLY